MVDRNAGPARDGAEAGPGPQQGAARIEWLGDATGGDDLAAGGRPEAASVGGTHRRRRVVALSVVVAIVVALAAVFAGSFALAWHYLSPQPVVHTRILIVDREVPTPPSPAPSPSPIVLACLSESQSSVLTEIDAAYHIPTLTAFIRTQGCPSG